MQTVMSVALSQRLFRWEDVYPCVARLVGREILYITP